MAPRLRTAVLVVAFVLATALSGGAPSASEEEPEYGPQAEPDDGSPAPQQPRPRQPSRRATQQNPQGMTEDELRLHLMQKSMRFGGIFGPLIDPLNKPGTRDECGGYTDHAACQAYKAGDGWAAERLQRKQANPSERDWYNR